MRRRLRDGRDGRALIEELERMGESLTPPAARSHWFLELGVVCEMLVPERQRALQLYRHAVDIDPSNGEALDRGRLVCRELGRLDEFIRLCEIDLLHERDEERREQLTARIGEALLDLGDRQRAAGFLVGAAGSFPASLPIQDALGTVGYDDDWRTEVDRLSAIGEDAQADIGARVSLRAARILHMQAPDDERYEELLLRVLDYDPYDESAQLLLDAFYTQAQRWDDLEALQKQLVHAFPGADEQAALSQRFSFSWIARAQHDRADEWCWRAIELGRLVYPIAGLTMLRGIYAARRQWDRLLDAIDALLGTPLDEDAIVHVSLLGGTIAWKAKSDLPRAGGYFDRVRRVALDSVLLVDFDDALADARNPEVVGEAQRALIDAARRAGKVDPIERVIDAWKKAIAADPSKRAPRRALARVLHRAERWRTLADALKDEEAHACRDDVERVALLMQLAALYRDRLRQDLLLTQTLQRAIELQPGNLAALDQLERAFAGMRRWSDVVATLKHKLAHVAEDAERVELHLKIAALYREQLGNDAEAIKSTESALALDPSRADLADWLELAYSKRRDWEKLYLLKQKKAALPGYAAERLAAAVELAQLAADKLKKPAVATAAWAEVLALDPDHEAALSALERLYAAADEHAKLADVYTRRAAQSGDMTAQLAYLQKLAQLCTTQLDDPARAIDAWRKVLDLQPVHARALETLKRLYVTTRSWDLVEQAFAEERRLDECARLFEQQAAGDEGAAVELWLRAARLWRVKLKRRVEAQRAYERALALAPGQREATEALAALYDESGDARKLSGVLALQIEHTDDAATRRTRLLRLAGLHARELHDAAGAFAWQRQAFDLAPGDGAVRAELERLAGASGQWRELVQHYEALCAAPDDGAGAIDGAAPVDRVALLATVAREKETLGDVDGALATWQALAERTPPPPEALPALARIYEARGDWRALHDVHARKLALAGPPEERRPIVSAMAALAERQGDDERAIAAYRRLWDEFGADDTTLEALERLYGRGGALAQLETVLVERRGLAAAPASRTALTFRLAEVRRRRDQLPEAIALLAEVLDDEPQHAGAQAALDAITEGPSHRLEAALLLEPIARAALSFERLARVLRIRAAHAPEPHDAVALLHEIAWIEERQLGLGDAAFETLVRALETEPSHQPTFDQLERLSVQAGDWQRLLGAYRQVAARPLSITEHVEVRCRLGALYRQHIGDVDRALATFRRVLDLAPDDARATRAIDDLLAAAGRWSELGERLRESLAHSYQAERALKLATLLETQVGDREAAVDVYAELLARAPNTAEASAGLERLFAAGVARQRVAALLMPRYREAGRAADLVRIWSAAYVDAPEGQSLADLVALARSVGELPSLGKTLPAALANATEPATRAALRLVLAELASERGDEAAAEATLRQLLDEEPTHAGALAALDALLVRAGRRADRVAILARRAECANGAERVELLLTLGELQASLDDLAAARVTFEASLALGEDARPLRALARLGDDDSAIGWWQRLRAALPDDTEALMSLAALYEHRERWAELAEVLERQLAHAEGESAAMLVEQQALVFTRLGNAAAAEAAWRRLHALRPGSPDPLHALARRFRTEQRWDELAEVLGRLVELPIAADEVRSAATELARLETGTLERPARAIAAWQRLLALDPDADEALAQLASLYARTDRPAERRQVLERRAERALRELHADAAAIADEAAVAAVADGDGAAAEGWYRRVVEREPLHGAAQAYLEDALRGRAAWAEVASLLRARAAHLPAHERGAQLAAVAELQERELGDRAAAFATLLDAYAADGEWDAHGEELKRLAVAADSLPILAATLQQRAANAPPAARAALCLELGGVLELQRQIPAAIEAYRAALTVDDGCLTALERLEQIYRTGGQSALLDVLARRAALATDRDEQLALYRALAVEAVRFERWGRAVEAHRAAADREPRAPERAAELFAAGVIYRDHLADFDEARSCIEAAIGAYTADDSEPPSTFGDALKKLRSGTRAADRN